MFYENVYLATFVIYIFLNKSFYLQTIFKQEKVILVDYLDRYTKLHESYMVRCRCFPLENRALKIKRNATTIPTINKHNPCCPTFEK